MRGLKKLLFTSGKDPEKYNTWRPKSRKAEEKETGIQRQCKKREGDYYLECSKGVYFSALLLLTSYRIRHCEERSQWM